MHRRTLIQCLAAAAAAPLAWPAFGQNTKIVLGYTAVTDFASAFVAAEQGYFAKRKLDVEMKFIPLNSTIPIRCRSADPRPRFSCRRWMVGWTW